VTASTTTVAADQTVDRADVELAKAASGCGCDQLGATTPIPNIDAACASRSS
jgi:hypothetical protein